MDITWDRETTGLLNQEAIDYTSSPFKLKDTFKTHCTVVEEHETGKIIAFYDGPEYILDGRRYEEVIEGQTYILENYQPVEFEKRSITEFKDYVLNTPLHKVVAHNQINFDLMVGKIEEDMDFTVEQDTWCGKPVLFEDTLVISKALNPDRLGGHSLDSLSEKAGLRKIAFRKQMHDSIRFKHFAADMLFYCIVDVLANTKVYKMLETEKGDWDWSDAISLEKSVAEIITRQEHRGFDFKTERAIELVRDLDIKLEALRSEVEPVLPPKPLAKTRMDFYTPGEKQFKKSGELNENIKKFVAKHEGTISEDNVATIFGKEYPLPMPSVPLITEVPSTLKDTTHIKEWLVSKFSWNPSAWKERDLTCDAKKNRLTPEKFVAAVERYVEQTLASPFCKYRLEHLNLNKNNIKAKLLAKGCAKSFKVLTNPTLTVGQGKEICPGLIALESSFPHARKLADFLTYSHRRNSILGGGYDPEEDDDEHESGFMPNVREDGRIPTPADTCGAGTSRFKHRLVANIPRNTSLYGEEMRSLFGVGRGYVQLGYDFDSLEAKIESHYVYRYKGGPEYGISLTAEKPNDCHSVLARRISAIIGREFPRNSAKSVKYGCLPTDNTFVMTENGWVAGTEVKVGDLVLGYNKEKHQNEWTKVTATHFYKDAYVEDRGHKNWNIESTLDHRWYGSKLKQYGNNKNCFKVWEPKILTTEELVQTFNILNTAPYIGGDSQVTPEESALVAWLLADGHYKWSELSEATSCAGGKRKGIIASIAQASHKYQEEVKTAITACGLSYTESALNSMNENTMTSYRLKSVEIREFMDRVVEGRTQKHDVDWVKWILGLSKESLESFVHAFWLADGNSKSDRGTSRLTFKQNVGNIADALLVAGYLLGYNVTQRGGIKCSNIRFQKNRPHTTCQEFKTISNRTTDVFCLTTELDTFVIKQGGIITITGNCSYNAQVARVAKIVGCDLETAQIIFDEFWTLANPLKELKDRMQQYWETTGQKKFLLGIDKRKLPIRSKGNVINSAFQSAGVICAKRAMVIHDRKLKAEGLAVDFFKDDWKSKKYCQQMIAYHDEAQLELTRDLVKFKMFDTEKEAKEFSEEGKIWSDVGHAKDGRFFRSWCRAGELAAESVKEAGQYYKLNVELTAGYVIGSGWDNCH